MKSPILPILLAGAVGLLSAGCQRSRLKLTAEQKVVRNQLCGIDPRKDPLPAKTPIIDVHTHTFNARYLPLEGILLGKRDAAPPFTWILTDHCAKTLAEVLIQHTELASIPGSRGAAREVGTQRVRVLRRPGLICRVFLKVIDKAIEAGAWNPEMKPREQMAMVDQAVVNMNFAERVALRSAAKMMGMGEHLDAPTSLEGLKSIARYLWLITQNDARLVQLYRDFHAGAPMKGPIHLVSHTMDLGPVYNQPPSGRALLDFPTEQVKRIQYYQRHDPHLTYFIAYNPYRDYEPGGRHGDSLRLVQEAIRSGRAGGVKVYPPSGYRAAGNKINLRPRAWFTRAPGAQWDARYGGLGEDRDAALNRKLDELLTWCIDNKVPVFTHAGHGEFEARKGYGEYHANPKWWLEYLKEYSNRTGRTCQLRLCFGHAGGSDFWFGKGHLADWGKTVYEACTQYPHVYCEVTTGSEILDQDQQAFFVDRLIKLFGNDDQVTYRFSSKLLYGTDWYQPDAGLPKDVLLATQTAFLHPSLQKYYRGYFYDNARAYLRRR